MPIELPELVTHYYRPASRPLLSLTELPEIEVERVLRQPGYFVLGEFSLWEGDGSCKLQLPLSELPAASVSFTLTDSFFNYRRHNLRGVAIPPRPYHGQLFTLGELPEQIERYGLPGDAWRTEPARRFDVYIEAQLWCHPPSRPPS